MGSGKTTVGKILAALPRTLVLHTDDIAKKALAFEPYATAVRDIFGIAPRNPVTPEGIREAFFTDEKKRAALQAVTGRVVKEAVDAVCISAPLGTLIIVESALIYERDITDWFQKIVVATCPYTIRIARLTAGRGMKPADIERRLALQLPETELVRRADHIIDTGCMLAELELRTRTLYETLLSHGEQS